MNVIRFQSEMTRTGQNTTGIVVPQDIIEKLAGGARPAVVARINDYTYRTTVGIMSGQAMLPFSAQHREASGINGGDRITVELHLDTQSRDVEVPDDLAKALAAAGSDMRARFDKQAPSRRKADVESVNSAKTTETRARRIASIVTKMIS